MVKVTLSLVRQRAEHNEGILSSLEELALHQQDLTDLGQLPVWCPRLKILLLQGNLLSDLGKLGRLRELQYLNLALNNLERLPSGCLGGCDALTKLDLTANFLADLTGTVSTLQELTSLTELYLNGNPVCQYPGYRAYVVAWLPGLQELDGEEVMRHERIRALQDLTKAGQGVERAQRKTMALRDQQRKTAENENQERIRSDKCGECDDGSCSEDDEQFSERWNTELSDHCPETRLTMHEELRRRREKHERGQGEAEGTTKPKEARLYAADGRPLNLNQAKIEFKFTEDVQQNAFLLEVFTYKYLDPSLLQCSVEPSLVRVTIKGKVLQLVLPEEVKSDVSTAKRSQTTGHLLVVMPKVLENSFLSSVVHLKAPTNGINGKKSDNEFSRANSFQRLGEYRNDAAPPKGCEESSLDKDGVLSRGDVTDCPEAFVDNPSVPDLE